MSEVMWCVGVEMTAAMMKWENRAAAAFNQIIIISEKYFSLSAIPIDNNNNGEERMRDVMVSSDFWGAVEEMNGISIVLSQHELRVL